MTGTMRINQELDKISGMGRIVSDKIEELEGLIKTMVSDIWTIIQRQVSLIIMKMVLI